jgi:hypothetical protein
VFPCRIIASLKMRYNSRRSWQPRRKIVQFRAIACFLEALVGGRFPTGPVRIRWQRRCGGPGSESARFCGRHATNPDDGLNLARCFPGSVSGKATERLAASLFEHLGVGADYLIDLHSGGVEYVFLPLAGFYGPAEKSNHTVARLSVTSDFCRTSGNLLINRLPPDSGSVTG